MWEAGQGGGGGGGEVEGGPVAQFQGKGNVHFIFWDYFYFVFLKIFWLSSLKCLDVFLLFMICIFMSYVSPVIFS